jgi:hypothetical protein
MLSRTEQLNQQALTAMVSVDKEAEQIVCEGRKYEDQKKARSAIEIKHVTENKKNDIAQSVLEQQPLRIIANDDPWEEDE